jgi:hypothetical protein
MVLRGIPVPEVINHTVSWHAFFHGNNTDVHYPLRLHFNGTTIQGRYSGGELKKENLVTVDLLNRPALEHACPGATTSYFTQCTGKYRNVALWRSAVDDNLQATVGSPAARQRLATDLGAFAPHIVAVKNALVNWDGGIFDLRHFYQRGGCADFAWHTWPFEYSPKYTRIATFNEPLIALTQPYETAFAHELIDVYSNLVALRPVLRAFPHIKILARTSALGHPKYFPLLRAHGIEPTQLRFLRLGVEQRIVHAPYIIAPLNRACNVLTRSIAAQMLDGIRSLPTLAPRPRMQILFHDRVLEKMRRMTEGEDIYWQLKREMEHPDLAAALRPPRPPSRANRTTAPPAPRDDLAYAGIDPGSSPSGIDVVRFFGNESFDDVVRLWSTSFLVIAAHGAGLVNMIFMHANTTVLEVRPNHFEVLVFEHMADSLFVNYNVIRHGRPLAQAWKSPITIPRELFFSRVRPVLDNLIRTLQRRLYLNATKEL